MLFTKALLNITFGEWHMGVTLSTVVSTAGLLFLETHTNNQFANESERLGKENPDLSGLFLFRHYFKSYIE